ncbi:type II secretion system protein [Patescibacteria group bacterium]
MGRSNFKGNILKKGFTLVELMIVISILSFLVLVSVLASRTQIFKGYDARRKGDIHKIQVAVEEYEKDNNCYPLPQYVACNPGVNLKPYTNKVPCDPRTNASYFYDHQDSACPQWYRIYSKLENENDESIISNIGPNGAFNYSASSPNAPSVVQVAGGSPTAAPSGGGEEEEEEPPLVETDFYGCRSGVCTPILWDVERGAPECDPNFQNPTCYDVCDNPGNECTPWK